MKALLVTKCDVCGENVTTECNPDTLVGHAFTSKGGMEKHQRDYKIFYICHPCRSNLEDMKWKHEIEIDKFFSIERKK